MSRIYKQYIMLKIKNPDKYFLFKAGIFFIFIDEDAKHMSKILNLKIGNLNNKIVKCGFPKNSLNKYMSILKNLNYDIAIIDTQDNLIYNFDTYNIDSKIKNIMDEIINTNIDKLSISEAYDFLNKIQNEISSIYNEVTK